MTKTTIPHEVQVLAARLIEAGVPPAIVAVEFMAAGAGMLQQILGAEHVEKQCAAIAAAVRELPAAMH